MRPPVKLISIAVPLVALASWVSLGGLPRSVAPVALAASEPVIAAAGDIACKPSDTANPCRMQATADLLVDADRVLTLGDNQYERGEYENFLKSFDPTWGDHRSKMYPSVGNHEYKTEGAAGYFRYFGTAAGTRGEGWYSFNVGSWHVIALNSNCSKVGGCGRGRAQHDWLKADLQANAGRSCTLAFWHHARFSSGPHGNFRAVRPLWNLLDRKGVDVALVAHDHLYERFAPQDKDGNADPNGIRQFVVGTGGKNLYAFEDVQPNSVKRINDAFGVLFLTLSSNGYAWAFTSIADKVLDSGSATCV